MTQNRTNDNSSENIIEQVNEQELHNITGGCIVCTGVAAASTYHVLEGVKQVGRARRAGRDVPATAVVQTVAHADLAARAATHASLSPVPCEHCIGNITHLVTLKTAGF